ncbi:MAG: hypothetical protein HPM95_09555 [Alphaproteobacteria bacterium]|nr:hypothetical protein [Alphaproteobacteria bacterium]
MATRRRRRICAWHDQQAVPETIWRLGRPDQLNNTRTAETSAITPDGFTGRYVHWGIRELA